MRGVLTHPHGAGAGLRHNPRFLTVIGETPQVDRATRLSIYGDGYFLRIVEVMAFNYSSVKNLIGADAFDDLARRYLIKHPSTFKSIDDVGHRLSQFIKKDPLAKKWPFLSDLAALEWTAHQAFFANNVPPINTKLLAGLPPAAWTSLRLELDPSVKIQRLDWPVAELWRMDGKWKAARLRKLKKKRTAYLIFRQRDKFVRVTNVSEVQETLLIHLSKGKTLRHALTVLAKKHRFNGDLPPIRAWFHDWASSGVISGVAKKR